MPHSNDQTSNAVKNPAAVLFVAAFAAFLATFNETFLNVGFAPIMESLDVDVSTVQWLATAYMLGAAVMVPVSAFAYRSFSTRPLFCCTTALLVIGSVVGAMAPNFIVLLIGRIVQALGTGMLIPIGMNITLEIAPREKLGSYMGIMGAMTTLGPSSSVILAGLILSFAPWQALLWAFAGLSLLCLIVGAVILRDVAHLTHPRLDAASVALIGIALVGILYAISTAFTGNLISALIAAVIGIISLIAFVFRQNRLEEPLINLEPLRVAPFAIGVIINMLALLTIFAMNIIVPTFMQSVLGTPSLIASLTLFPAILASCVLSPIAGRVYDKMGPGLILPLGFALITVFSILTGVFLVGNNALLSAILYIPVIAGSALIIGPVQSFALSKLSYEQNPHGVTIMSTGFQIAGCVGSSVFTGIYAFVGASGMADGLTFDVATNNGMVVSGILVGVVALVGFFMALVVRSLAKKTTATESAKGIAPGEGAQAAAMSEAAPDHLAWEEAAVENVAASGGLVTGPSLSSIMKTDVFSLNQDSSVADAMSLFVDKGISGAPVCANDGQVVGFISDGDIMRSLADQVPAFKSAWSFMVELENADFERTVEDVMAKPVSALSSKNVICVDANDDMGTVARVLAEKRLKKAPVVKDGRMVGIINRSNITGYAVSHFLESKRN